MGIGDWGLGIGDWGLGQLVNNFSVNSIVDLLECTVSRP